MLVSDSVNLSSEVTSLVGGEEDMLTGRLASCASASAVAGVGLPSATTGSSAGDNGPDGCSEGGNWFSGAGLDFASGTVGALGNTTSDTTVGAAAAVLLLALALDDTVITLPLLVDPSNVTTVSTGKSIHPANTDNTVRTTAVLETTNLHLTAIFPSEPGSAGSPRFSSSTCSKTENHHQNRFTALFPGPPG